MISCFNFLVKKRMRKTPQGEMVDTYALECLPLEPSATWKLAEEDPLVYIREDREGYNPARQWSSEPYPRVPEPTRSTDPVPEPAPALDLKQPLAMHHLMVDYCLSLGEDPCRNYQATKVSNIVESIVAGDKECSICHEKLSNTQRLRAHVRAQHMDETPFHCDECDRHFGDKSTLNLYMRKHDKDAPTHACPTCQKPFTVKSRMKEHEKSHLLENLDQPCQFCGKKIRELKNLRQHERNCKQNPNKETRKQCPYCPKDYQQKKDLRHHVKTSHASRFANWEQDFVS